MINQLPDETFSFADPIDGKLPAQPQQHLSHESSNGSATAATSTTCGLCFEEAPITNGCSGRVPHYLCNSCFVQYARAELEPGGAYDGVREGETKNDDGSFSTLVSKAGNLPCYLFVVGECDCASIPPTIIARILSTDADVLRLHDLAKCRVYATKQEEERIKAEIARKEKEKKETRMDVLRDAVREALSRGGHVACPSCGANAQKNDACMHMQCTCGTSYCYCCGRHSRRAFGCPIASGCDSQSAFLEHNPGWNNLNLEGETQGMGALHEFHRRRMMFFLRDVKNKMHPGEWEELRRTSPELLDNVPTPGRFISWDDVAEASPPLFGSTREHQLQWASEGNRAIANVEHDAQQRARLGQIEEGKKYKFGDITRSIIAKGKGKDGRSENDSYRFGDFTRGLLG